MSAGNGPSFANAARRAISHPNERRAIVLLDRAGWTHGELAMCFECGETAIERVIKREGGEP